MSIKVLMIYVQICNVLDIDPTWYGLNKFKDKCAMGGISIYVKSDMDKISGKYV